MKNCKNCKIVLSDFNWHKSRQNNNYYLCNICYKDKLSKYYSKNYKKIRENSDKFYKKNPKTYGTVKWANSVASRYKYTDSFKKRNGICNLTGEDILEIIQSSCIYCGDKSSKKSIERIDNSIGHIKTNVVSACVECNSARMDNFTFEEMKILGKTIAKIKALRRSNGKHAI